VVSAAASTSPLRIGSRGSALALWQARHVKKRLEQIQANRAIEIVIIRTTGDRITDVPLSRIGDRGLFTKELDRAILDREIDLAVHSLKDVPTLMAEGLALAAVLERADPRDALVVAPGQPKCIRDLPQGARVGTSSLRRRAQLLALRPDLTIAELRGNLDTRLSRVAAGSYDAALLAYAGLQRLGLQDHAAEVLDSRDWLPAPGQGALGIATRADDPDVRSIVEQLDHPATRLATTAERALLHALEGGCQIPIGALGAASQNLVLHGLVASIDGKRVIRGSDSDSAADPVRLGERLARELIRQGAQDILDEIRSAQTPDPAAP
jgi:hydroxymethylbilane synthase